MSQEDNIFLSDSDDEEQLNNNNNNNNQINNNEKNSTNENLGEEEIFTEKQVPKEDNELSFMDSDSDDDTDKAPHLLSQLETFEDLLEDEEEENSSEEESEKDKDTNNKKKEKKSAKKLKKNAVTSSPSKAPAKKTKSALESELEAEKFLNSMPTETELRRRKLIEMDEDELEESIINIRDNSLKSLKNVLKDLKKKTLYQSREETKINKEKLVKNEINKQNEVKNEENKDANNDENIEENNEKNDKENEDDIEDQEEILFIEKEIKKYKKELKEYLDDEETSEYIEKTIEKTLKRMFGYDLPPFNVIDYLYDDSDEEENNEENNEENQDTNNLEENQDTNNLEENQESKMAEEKIEAENGIKNEIDMNKDDLIILSDSEDDEINFSSILSPKSNNTPLVQPSSSTSTNPISSLLSSLPPPPPQSSRTNLLLQLRQRAKLEAHDNYCNKKKLSKEKLHLYVSIEKTCQKLINLLREKYEKNLSSEMMKRRERYMAMKSEDEAEFEDEVYEDGKFLSAKERNNLFNLLSRKKNQIESENELSEEDIDYEEAEVNASRAFRRYSNEDEEVEEEIIEQSEENNMEVDADVEDEEIIIARKMKNKLITEDRTEEGLEDDQEESFSNTTKVLKKFGKSSKKFEESVISTELEMNEDDEKEVEEELKESKEKRREKKIKTGNSLFRLQLEEEERRARNSKSSRLLDEEAEEDEDELQTGLGDFGFGNMEKIREAEAERDALRLRKGDLDHIVDDISSDEGDEQEGLKRRLEMEEREDREKIRNIITAVTEGRDALKRQQNMAKKGYSFEKLVGEFSSKKKHSEGDDNGEDGDAEEDFDEEEMLQRGLTEKIQRERDQSIHKVLFGEDEDEDEEEEEDEERKELLEAALNAENDEDKEIKLNKLKKFIEKSREEKMMRKKFKQDFEMRKKMRLANSQQKPSLARSITTSSFLRTKTTELGISTSFNSSVRTEVAQKRSFSSIASTTSINIKRPTLTESNSESGMYSLFGANSGSALNRSKSFSSIINRGKTN